MSVNLEKTIKTLEELKAREKRMHYPNEQVFIDLKNNRLEAHDIAIHALTIINRLLYGAIWFDANLDTDYGEGYCDGVEFLLDKVEEWWNSNIDKE